MQLEHIISTSQFDRKTLEKLFVSAARMEKIHQSRKPSKLLAGKTMAAIFYEPSTRTRLSFESAMLKLGGQVISTENAAQFSSAIKGESIEDTVRIVGLYADAIVLRHPQIGTAAAAAKVSPVPIINAGDGAGEHPTQALLDLYTIQKELGRIDGLTIAFVGDLLNGRTVHSLLDILPRISKNTIHLVAPKKLQLPASPFATTDDLESILPKVDVLYMTRIQKERFASLSDYEKVKNAFVLNGAMVQRMKKKSIILHPLPRVTEITPDVDTDPRAAYFRQAQNGLYVRMALLAMLLK